MRLGLLQMPLSDCTPPSANGDGSTTSAEPAWTIQKYGGTSVGKFAINIVDQIVLYVVWSIQFGFQLSLTRCVRPSLADQKVAVVCSARSSSSKAEGTTNR